MSDAQYPAVEIAKTVVGELDHFQLHFRPAGGALTYQGQHQLMQEPFVAYARVADRGHAETRLLICRHYIPFGYSPHGSDIDFASYLSPLGRIISKLPGEEHHFQVRNHSGVVLETHHFQLLDKDEFRLNKVDGRWDAVDNQILWIGGRMFARSLRGLLEGEAEQLEIREFRYSVQLPDRAILDQVQDDIFRLPLAGRVRISGAPGTGKTTVLLKRLSQKTKREFLSEQELAAIPDRVWRNGQNWLLFTPSDLLKSYLKEAMAKELLPASDEHVKVYRTFRLELLREIGFIRVGQTGYFKIAPEGRQLLKRISAGEQINLAKAFGQHLGEQLSSTVREALQRFNNKTRNPLGKLTDANQRVLHTALDTFTQASGDAVELRQRQQQAAVFRELNERLNTLISAVRRIGGLQEEIESMSMDRLYRQARMLPDLIEAFNTSGFDVAKFPELPPLVVTLRDEMRQLNETLSVGHMFQVIPRAYQEFRESGSAQGRYFQQDAAGAIQERLLTELEGDVLLYHALEFIRSLIHDIPGDLVGVSGDVRSMLSRFRLLVAVDEVTDFSPLEIACIERLAQPGSGGVTICGDLMQRVTEHGLKEWAEVDALGSVFDARELQISYRQTHRLFAIARDLYQHATGEVAGFSSAFPERKEDPPPLCFRTSGEHSVEKWITDRICEIHELSDRHLPTTAILVPTPGDAAELKRRLMPTLRDNGLEVEASEGGAALGDTARVRIFPVEFIKGLEFEAVFYVGLDRMAEVHRDLIDKYVYVGISRARSFLGVTVERQFPQRLKCIHDHFVQDGTWSGTPGE